MPRRESPLSRYSTGAGATAKNAAAKTMYHWIPFWPETAAVNAVVVNNLYIAEVCVSGLIVATVTVMMLTFCVRYRHGSNASRADRVRKTWHLEVGWTAATLGAFLILF